MKKEKKQIKNESLKNNKIFIKEMNKINKENLFEFLNSKMKNDIILNIILDKLKKNKIDFKYKNKILTLKNFTTNKDINLKLKFNTVKDKRTFNFSNLSFKFDLNVDFYFLIGLKIEKKDIKLFFIITKKENFKFNTKTNIYKFFDLSINKESFKLINQNKNNIDFYKLNINEKFLLKFNEKILIEKILKIIN